MRKKNIAWNNSLPLLDVHNLSVAFKTQKGPDFTAVHGTTFSIFEKQTVALVGESGSGKTVTGYSILGLLPYPTAYHPSGSVAFQDVELLNRDQDFLRTIRGAQIGMIFQEPLTALNPLHTIEEQIMELLKIHKVVAPAKMRNRVEELMDLVGFSDGIKRLDSYPHQLSGGQRQRVMIAMALACNPKLLIADEPTTALDVTIQEGIINLLNDLKRQMDMSILLISHDLSMVKKMADHIIVMKTGDVIEQNKPDIIFEKPVESYTVKLIHADPKGAPQELDDSAETILSVDNLTTKFGKKTILKRNQKPFFTAVDDVSLALKSGETLGIVGESGSGKSTLIYSILKLIPTHAGRIVFCGKDIQKLNKQDMRNIRSQLQIVFQDPFGALNPRMTVEEILIEGLDIHQPELSQIAKHDLVTQILYDVGIDPDMRYRYPHEFSGGQRQRICIGRVLILRPKVLALDEPTSALDRSIQSEIVNLLRDLQKKYKLSYLFISHDLKVVKAMSHTIMVMRHGKIVEHGTCDDIINNPQTDYAKQLIRAAFG